jgi:hypothetical protein
MKKMPRIAAALIKSPFAGKFQRRAVGWAASREARAWQGHELGDRKYATGRTVIASRQRSARQKASQPSEMF